MPEKKPKGRDFPLSPTSMPQAVDNTRVSKRPAPKGEMYPAEPDYSWKDYGQKYTKQDSADYKRAYKAGIKEVSTNPEGKDRLFGKYKKGDYRLFSLSNDALNAGYNEGINKVLDRKAQKKK